MFFNQGRLAIYGAREGADMVASEPQEKTNTLQIRVNKKIKKRLAKKKERKERVSLETLALLLRFERATLEVVQKPSSDQAGREASPPSRQNDCIP